MVDQSKVLGAGRPLFKQGEKGGDLFFILSGQVDLTARDEESGAEAVIATVGEKAVIGTMSFLEGEPRSASAITKTEVTYVKVSQTQRDKLLKTVPPWFAVLVKDLSKNLRLTNSAFVKMKADKDIIEKKLKIKVERSSGLETELENVKDELKKKTTEWQEKDAAIQKELQALKSELESTKMQLERLESKKKAS